MDWYTVLQCFACLSHFTAKQSCRRVPSRLTQQHAMHAGTAGAAAGAQVEDIPSGQAHADGRGSSLEERGCPTWSTYQIASRKRGYWKWTTGRIRCPCRPQLEDYLCREMPAYPQRILPLDGCPCARHFSYLFFHCSACRGCVDLKFLVGGVVLVPSVSTQRSSSSSLSGVSAQHSSEELQYSF